MKKKLKDQNGSFHSTSLSPESFHRKSSEFTKKLKKIMKQNPSLPVVLLLPGGVYAGNLECDVAYVHDPVSGAFREKIIEIHSRNTEHQAFENYDIEPPF